MGQECEHQRVPIREQLAFAEESGHAGRPRLRPTEAGLRLFRRERGQGEGGRRQVKMRVRSQKTQASRRGLYVAMSKSKYS